MSEREKRLGDVMVYIVEDDEAVCDSIGVILESHGATVTLLHSLVETRAALAKKRPTCIVLDIHLPDGLGWDLLAKLREFNISVPAVVMTGQMQPRYRDLAKLLQVEILEKPLDGDDVAAKIAALVRKVGEPE